MFALFLLALPQPLKIRPNLFMNLGIAYSACHIRLYRIVINYSQVTFGRNYIASLIFALRCLLQHTLKRMDPLNDQIKQQLKPYGTTSIDDRQIGWIISST